MRQRKPLSDEQKKINLARIKKWKSDNPEKVKASGAAYRERYKERDALKRLKNKDAINKRAKEHRLQDTEFNRKRREFRNKNLKMMRQIEKEDRNKNRGKWQIKSARRRAKDFGIEFDLDYAWIEPKIRAGVCELSGLPFDSYYRSPNLPSIDRINPQGPYTKENCRLILWALNRAMSDLGQDYLFSVLRAVFVKRGEILDYEDRMAA